MIHKAVFTLWTPRKHILLFSSSSKANFLASSYGLNIAEEKEVFCKMSCFFLDVELKCNVFLVSTMQLASIYWWMKKFGPMVIGCVLGSEGIYLCC